MPESCRTFETWNQEVAHSDPYCDEKKKDLQAKSTFYELHCKRCANGDIEKG